MKKNILYLLFALLFLIVSVDGFAAEGEIKKTGKVVSAGTGQETNVQTVKPQVVDQDAFDGKDFYVATKELEPVATVLGTEKKEAVTVTGKTGAVKAEPAIKASSKAVPAKRAVTPKKKSEVPSEINDEAMAKRWKNLFSKELTKDSILYTVKPGDSFYVLAHKNHTTIDLIKRINNLKGDNLYAGTKLKIHTASFLIRVDKSKNTLTLYSDGLPVKKYSVATGKKNCTPVGEFEIKDKLVNPTWFKTGAIFPPGSPKNGLGTRWMGFDKPSYGIHGTIDPKSIGTQASEGCVRMLNEDVEELYSIVPVGTKVTIQD